MMALITAPTANKEVADSISAEIKHTESVLSSLSFDEIVQRLVDGAVDLGVRILIAVVVFYIGKLIINKIHTIIKAIMLKHNFDKSLTTFVLSVVKITLLFVLKPYKIGDYIEFGSYQGTVKEIQIFNTILNTPDNKSIIIPNGGLSTGTINNYSKEEYRRVSWDISISYGDDVDVARKVALEILEADSRVVKKYREDDKEMRQAAQELAPDNEEKEEKQDEKKEKKSFFQRIFGRKPKLKDEVEKWKEEQAEKIKAKVPKVDCTPTVSLSALADSSIVVTIRAWTRSEFYWGVLYDVNEKIYKEFPKNGLSFPYPQMDIHVTQGA